MPAVLDTLDRLCCERGIVLDAAQARAATRLAQLHAELSALKAKRSSFIGRHFSHLTIPRSLYLWGGVGRGKSFLMDAFYAAVPQRRKLRIHFHAFMREVHADLRTLKHEADPLLAVAESIAQRYRLVCLDEFHVSDIADAMILGRLLANCLDHGVVFVLTSNDPPAKLYADGLQRQNFLPTIALIEERMDVLEVDAGIDYRRRTLELERVYHWPADAAAEEALARTFSRLVVEPSSERSVRLLERDVPVVARGAGVIWFTFAVLCETPRSQLDYLELAQAHHTLLLSGVPRLATVDANVVRRFTLLVDVLYDHRVKLILTAAAPLEALARFDETVRDADTRRVLSEFARTASRLVEMQSAAYMGEAHLSALKR
ncbi:MAG: cell division protein ZapE [Casimicrobiaceae bacterium]|nr:cell division protein ZapE [Casimicrobiaceae bacterium]MCX8099272.1 cell division protein ZapE [Casimicrobiaceae bacterium]